MSKLTTLRLDKLYHLSADLLSLFRAFGKPQYFAQLDSTESHDEVLIHGLRHHMDAQQQVSRPSVGLKTY